MLRKYNATFGFCVLVAYKSLQSNLLLIKSHETSGGKDQITRR